MIGLYDRTKRRELPARKRVFKIVLILIIISCWREEGRPALPHLVVTLPFYPFVQLRLCSDVEKYGNAVSLHISCHDNCRALVGYHPQTRCVELKAFLKLI